MPGRRSSLVWLLKPGEAERIAGLDDIAFARAVERHAPSEIRVTESGEWRVHQAMCEWEGRFPCPVSILPDTRFIATHAEFRAFADGRKHLTYNLPKTGLKGNFTRAYYSASGRHTLTGACEENTVKIMCTYTGEMLSHIELYPGKKDKSIYIQVRINFLSPKICSFFLFIVPLFLEDSLLSLLLNFLVVFERLVAVPFFSNFSTLLSFKLLTSAESPRVSDRRRTAVRAHRWLAGLVAGALGGLSAGLIRRGGIARGWRRAAV